MNRTAFVKERFWLAPFVGLALIVGAAWRPPPAFPKPAHYRVITDARGDEVVVPLPFRAVIGYAGAGFLETTHAPETLDRAGGNARDRARFSSGIMARIYPQVAADDALWGSPPEVEQLLASDANDTYFHVLVEKVQRVGLPAPVLTWRPPNRDEQIFSGTRIEGAAMGREDRAEAFIADYKRAFADLERELRASTLAQRPRVLTMGAATRDWNFLFVIGVKETRFDDLRIGVENAAEGFEDIGRQQDAERILAMDPDILFTLMQTPEEFARDPRWRGLRAVRENRVYQGLRSLRGSLEPLNGLDLRPLWARWTAELAHPERFSSSKLRALLRAHFATSYGYRLSEDEIDDLLRIDENKASSGYERFLGAKDERAAQ
jgi:iron complex transport system substrate-binding protein